MKSQNVFDHRTLSGVLSLLMVGLLLNGCSWFDNDHENPTGPAETQECGSFFCYQASPLKGILITSDFTQAHIAGQPYGNWSIKVEWRTPENEAVFEQIVPVEIDAATGVGSAQVSAETLKMVFAEVSSRYAAGQDLGLWLQQPGLRLGFFPADDETWGYYQFD